MSHLGTSHSWTTAFIEVTLFMSLSIMFLIIAALKALRLIWSIKSREPCGGLYESQSNNDGERNGLNFGCLL